MPASLPIAWHGSVPQSKPAEPERAVNSSAYVAYLRRALPFLIAALVLLGLCARVRQYAARASYWYDEAYLLLNIFDKDYRELLGPLRDNQAGPPVYFWSLRCMYLAAGSEELVMRLPAFVASLLGLFAMIVAARRLLPHAGWLWAVGLCATCKQAADRGAEVKPYSWDFLATLLILLTANICLSGNAGRRRIWQYICLFALAVLAPWCSLPSVFVLGGVGMALLYRALRRRTFLNWGISASFQLVCLASAAALYYFVLRHQRTTALDDYWKDYFGDISSLGGLLSWAAATLVRIGQYGSNGLGVPLLLFAVAGGWLLARRSPIHLILLAGPLLLAMAASLLRCYPLDGRLTFSLLPCLYLLAAESIGALAEAVCSTRCSRRLAVVCLTGLTLLLVPGIGPAAQMAVLAPEPGFREAFDYARRQGDARNVYWVSHPQVFEVYFRRDLRCRGSYDNDAEVVEQARGRRLWLVWTGPRPQQLEQQLQQAGFSRSDVYQSRCHLALLYTSRASRPEP